MARMLAGLRRRRALRTIAILLAAAVALALSQSAIVYTRVGGSRTFAMTVAYVLPSWLILLASVPVLVWLVRTFSFAPGSQARSTLAHITAGLAFALTHVIVITGSYLAVSGGPMSWARAQDRFNSFFRLFYQDTLAYGAIIAILLVIHYSDLRTRLAEARLTALRTQLNPHFLFNTLNALSTLALQGRRHDVADMLGRLGDLLRVTLDDQAQEVTLAAELDFVDDYAALQCVRFADRFRLEKDLAPETLNALVPSLILQPLVENAVEHGVGRSLSPGSVRIKAFRKGDSLTIDVTDTGPGFGAAGARERIGLGNTRLRLEELYGTRQRFECRNLSAGGAGVRITLPFREAVAPVDRAHRVQGAVLASTTGGE